MSTTFLASNAADSEALEHIEREHAELVGGLSARTSTLLATARGGAGWQADRDALVGWCRAVLVPHTEAEEAVLYPAARQSPQLEPLVRAMSHEQALLGNLIARLAAAPDAPTAIMHIGALQTLFETHVAKENDLLLPALAAASTTSLAQLRIDMETWLEPPDDALTGSTASPSADDHQEGRTCGCQDDAGGSPELDARTVPHVIRHATIFGALDAVEPGADLILVAPHDPLPLLEQVEQRTPRTFHIEYLERGPEAWRLRFTRTPAGAASK